MHFLVLHFQPTHDDDDDDAFFDIDCS